MTIEFDDNKLLLNLYSSNTNIKEKIRTYCIISQSFNRYFFYLIL